MKTSAEYFLYHKHLIVSLYEYLCSQLPFCSDQASEDDVKFLGSLKQLSDIDQYTDDYCFRGQSLVCRIIAQYPHLTPAIHRDLMWYFGGDCLHYMTDEEIGQYQQVDELLFQAQSQGQALDYISAKANVFKLH